MNYFRYKGLKFSYSMLPIELQEKALISFFEINLKYILTIDRTISIDKRINSKVIKQKLNSLNLIRKMQKDYNYAIGIFNANMVEFTDNGEYLNLFLEPR